MTAGAVRNALRAVLDVVHEVVRCSCPALQGVAAVTEGEGSSKN